MQLGLICGNTVIIAGLTRQTSASSFNDGVLIGDDLSDEEFHNLIKRQYEDILGIADEGFV
jgi:hypothetical protein